MLFVGLFQLVIGNLIIGVIESLSVKALFKHQVKTKTIIAGNYVSAFIGWIVAFLILDTTQLNIVRGYHDGHFTSSLLAYTAVVYAITLLAEYPFFKRAIFTANDEPLTQKALLKILIIVHVISYVLCIASWQILI